MNALKVYQSLFFISFFIMNEKKQSKSDFIPKCNFQNVQSKIGLLSFKSNSKSVYSIEKKQFKSKEILSFSFVVRHLKSRCSCNI
jgi:hypothetical protein